MERFTKIIPLNETHLDSALERGYLTKRFHLVCQQGELAGATQQRRLEQKNLLYAYAEDLIQSRRI